MSEERLATEIREAFEHAHEPSPGLENRVIGGLPWDEPRQRVVVRPRLAGTFAAVLAVATVVVLVAPTVLSRLNIAFPGSGVAAEPPAYSLAAVSGNSLFVVQRRGDNVLLQSPDGGRTWLKRIQFAGAYDGMQMFGQDGFVWSIGLPPSCRTTGGSCQPPSQTLQVYRTWDGGATWTALPATSFAANDVFFLDALHGWIDSGSPATGLGNDVLYATTDGAKTWKLVGPLPNSAPMVYVYGVGDYRVTFSRDADGSLHGWYVGNGAMFTSTDGGRSWRALFLHQACCSTRTFSQPVFSGQEGILPVAYRNPSGPDNATANELVFYVTHDGGATWTDTRSAPTSFAPVGDVLAITILDSQHIWLTSQSLTGGDNVQAGPAVARTSDGGVTWTVTHHTPRILQMTFRDATHGFALDVTGPTNVNGILETSDAGATWHRVTVPLFS
jgi:photosystem II stability/assembly factor-like uncharacterized protein